MTAFAGFRRCTIASSANFFSFRAPSVLCGLDEGVCKLGRSWLRRRPADARTMKPSVRSGPPPDQPAFAQVHRFHQQCQQFRDPSPRDRPDSLMHNCKSQPMRGSAWCWSSNNDDFMGVFVRVYRPAVNQHHSEAPILWVSGCRRLRPARYGSDAGRLRLTFSCIDDGLQGVMLDM